MSLGDVGSDDLINELEDRGYIVVDRDEYVGVLNQFKEWQNGGKA